MNKTLNQPRNNAKEARFELNKKSHRTVQQFDQKRKNLWRKRSKSFGFSRNSAGFLRSLRIPTRRLLGSVRSWGLGREAL